MRIQNLIRCSLVILFLISVSACAVYSPSPAPTTISPQETPPAASDPGPLLSEIIAQVTPAELSAAIGDLSGEWPVAIGGESYTLASRVQLNGDSMLKATQYVYEHLRIPGLTVTYFNWQLPVGAVTKGRNVVAELPGTAHPEEIVLMTAHLDDMVDKNIDPAGTAIPRPPVPVVDPLWNRFPAPGADDNASGTAGVLLAARILAGYRFARTVRFVFFAGEENGYLGSFAYARALREAGENIAAVFNLDMLAYDRLGEPVVDVNMRAPADSPLDGPLADAFLQTVSAYQIDLVPERQYQTGFYVGSDHGMFWMQGFPAISIMEDASGDFNPFYHSQYERLENLNMTYCANVIKAAIGAVVYLAGESGLTPAG
jgi:hypothetical protein